MICRHGSYAYFAKKGIYHLHKTLSSWIIRCAVCLSPYCGNLPAPQQEARGPTEPLALPEMPLTVLFLVFGIVEDVMEKFDT